VSSSEDFTPLTGEFTSLNKRDISIETCKHFGYIVGTRNGKTVQIAPYYKGGELVAQHIRGADKSFAWIGTAKDCELFGQHLWRDGGKKVVITEGEIDAMSVSQVQGNKWPVVSIPSGANGAAKAIKANLEWLEKFEEVILMMDMDEAGREAVADCAPLFTPGRCKVASLPLKDANDMLRAGKGSGIIEAIWGAKPYRPDGVVSVEDLVDSASEDIAEGTPWFLPSLTKATFGRRAGEIYALGAGTGVGKTDVFTQSIAFDVSLGIRCGVVYLEQPPRETVRRIAGKMVGKVLHVPGMASYEERREAIEALAATGLVHLYDHFGSTDWEVVKAKMRYMVVSLGCKHIYLDHLTALVAAEEDERKALDAIMADLAAFAQELEKQGCIVHFISHLTRPKDGPPHEEGGRVKVGHFRGSNAIGMWSHFMFGLERNQQADEGEQPLTIFRVLKDRNTGQATGKTITLGYEPSTGLLFETEAASLFPNRLQSSTVSAEEF
jgi:twinkle protein